MSSTQSKSTLEWFLFPTSNGWGLLAWWCTGLPLIALVFAFVWLCLYLMVGLPLRIFARW